MSQKALNEFRLFRNKDFRKHINQTEELNFTVISLHNITDVLTGLTNENGIRPTHRDPGKSRQKLPPKRQYLFTTLHTKAPQTSEIFVS